MADNFVEELLVGLGFDFEGEDGEQFKKQTEVIASTINKISLAAAVASAALFAMTKTQAATNDEFGKTATTIDTSVESLARWKQAAELAGVPGDQVVNMLERLKTVAQDAARTGAGPFQAYAELGVDFQALADGSLDVADGLENILAQARELDKALAQSALRELGIDVRLLELSPTDIQAAFVAADQFSGVTAELAKQSAEFNDAWTNVQLRLGGVANDLSSLLIPAFIKFFETTQNGLEWLQRVGIPILDEMVEKIGGWDVALSVLAGAAGLTAVVAAFTTILGIVSLIGGGLATIISSAGATTSILAPLLAIAGAGAAGFAVGTKIEENLSFETRDLIGETVAKTLAFFGNEEAQRNIERTERLKAHNQENDNKLETATTQSFTDSTSTTTNEVSNVIERSREIINSTDSNTIKIQELNNVVEKSKEVINNVSESFREVINNIDSNTTKIQEFNNVVERSKEVINNVSDSVREVINNTDNSTSVMQEFNNVVERSKEVINNVSDSVREVINNTDNSTSTIQEFNNVVERSKEVINNIDSVREVINNTESFMREIVTTTNNVVNEVSNIVESSSEIVSSDTNNITRETFTSVADNMEIATTEIQEVQAVTPESMIINVASVENGGINGQPVIQGGSKSIVNHNVFNGLHTSEIEAMMTKREREQNEFLDNDADDAIVR